MYDNIPVFPLDRPAMRPVELIPAETNGERVLVVRDPFQLNEGSTVLSLHPLLLVFMEMADGETTIAQMNEHVAEATGQTLPEGLFESIAQQLDDAYLLQSEKFVVALQKKRQAFLDTPVRPYTCFHHDEDDRLSLLKDLGDEFRRHLSGIHAPPEKLDLPSSSVMAVLSPHIDYNRGGHAYAWAYRAIREHGIAAKTWIILGTLHHQSSHRFIATRKNYDTPSGPVETDTELLEALEKEFGGELYRDEFSHASEHTVELQAIYLRQVFGDQCPKIVPILVGSFEDLLTGGQSPKGDEEVARFTAALRKILDERGDEVGIIGGVDLSHCGPQFGDEELNDEARQQAIGAGDSNVIAALETGDPERFFDAFRSDMNAQHVCSIAPMYCVMEAMRDRATPRTLTYEQHNSEDKSCLVSYCSVAFIRNGSGNGSLPKIVIATS